jgi:hypothetical protein
VSQPKGPRIPTARLNPPHAAKAMHSNVMFADRLLGLKSSDQGLSLGLYGLLARATSRADFVVRATKVMFAPLILG